MNADIIIDNENVSISFEAIKKDKTNTHNKNISIQKDSFKDTKIKKSQKSKDNQWNLLKN